MRDTSDIATHVAADLDLDPANEYNTGMSFDGTSVTITDAGGNQSVDISALAYDDTQLQTDVAQNTNDIATNASDIAAVQTDVAQNTSDIATNTSDIATNASDIAAVQTDVAQNTSDIATNTTGIATNTSDIAAVQTDVAQNTSDIATNATGIATNASDIASVQTDVAQNTSDIATNATGIATNASDLATHVAADLDLDPANEYNTGMSFDGTSVTITDAGGNQSVDISALAYDDTQLQTDVAQNTSDIATVQTDVAQNTSDIATNASDIATVQADVVQNTSDIATVQTDVAQNTSDIATNATGIATNASDIATVQTDVAQNTSDIATNATAIATNASDIATVQTDVAQNTSDIATNASDLATHVAADLDLDPANEYNTGMSFDGTSVTITDAGGNQSVDISALAYDDTQLQTDVAQNTSDIATNASDIATVQTDVAQNTSDIATNATGIAANASDIVTVQTDVAQNTSDIATNASDLATHVAADLDLDPANELQTLSITNRDLTISGSGGNTVSLPLTDLSQNTSTGVISYVNEDNTTQTANVIGAEPNNSITVGANGGAFYESPIKAFGKIASDGSIVRATSGITVTKLAGSGHYRVNLPAGLVSDANYIIQLTQPGRGGAGNDDPGIAYENQTSTSFEVIMGDNDNGGTDRARFNSEFMFTILDL